MATNLGSEYRKLFGDGGGKNTEVVCCRDCLFARLIQYGSNPVLADCLKKPNPDDARFPYQREVASSRWICPLYKHDGSEKEIEHREAHHELRLKGAEAAA